MKYYVLYPYKHWTFLVLATKKGLSDLYLYENHDLSQYLKDDAYMHQYKKLLDDFFKGKHPIDFPLDTSGTAFQKSVWQALLQVPFGKTSTYKEIALKINRPKASRAVGNAVGKNPVMLMIPCHRIIKTDGNIGGFSSDPLLKIDLLHFEKELFL